MYIVLTWCGSTITGEKSESDELLLRLCQTTAEIKEEVEEIRELQDNRASVQLTHRTEEERAFISMTVSTTSQQFLELCLMTYLLHKLKLC